MTAPLYQRYDEVTRRSTEVIRDDETGLPLIVHSQSVQPIVESAKRIASSFDKHRRNPDGWTHVARIPAVIWRQLQRLGITKDEKAFNAWLDLRECRAFRTDDARRL
jgi:hypothetical protein